MESLKKLLWDKFLLICFLLIAVSANAQINYSTYPSRGSSPALPNTTTAIPLSSGTVSNINFNWGGGQILNSGRADGVIVRFTGYYLVPGNGNQLYNFGITADDGIKLILNNVDVINYWGDQGPTFRSGTINLTGGTVVPVEIWFYENGGGAVLQWYWWNGSNWQLVNPENLSTDPTFGGTVNQLCCGGSAVSFSANQNFINRMNSFSNNLSSGGDNKVVIQQIGSSSTININQQGKKNSADIDSNGSSNNIVINQIVNSIATVNFLEIDVIGNNNTIDIAQSSSGGNKGILAIVNDNSNVLTIQQKNNGNHYAEITLLGSNKTVNLIQQGNASHMSRIELSGGATSLNATQSGSIQQFYSITHNCAQISCGPITVMQGQ